jgi:ribosomal protein L40E
VFLDANEVLKKLRESKFSWAVYVPIAVLLNVAASLSGSCLASVMVGIGTFGVPYLLGVKGLGALLKMGTLILVISGLVFGALYTYFLYEQAFVFEERTLHDTDIEGGIVTPYLGDDTTLYNFTITYTGTEDPDNISVYANITELGSLDESNLPLMNSGNVFYNTTTLTANVHLYYFSWHSNTTGGWNETNFGIGPVAAPYSDMLMLQMFQGMIIMFIPGGLFFYMIVLLYNSRKKEQERQKQALEDEKEMISREGKDKEEKAGEEEESETEEKEDEKKETAVVEGEFECTECGADVPGDAVVCPKCGEAFEEEEKVAELVNKDADEFECTECGADVPGDADVCPSCGESFDDEEGTEAKETEGTYMCSKCGADVPEGAAECPNCGESFDTEEKKED